MTVGYKYIYKQTVFEPLPLLLMLSLYYEKTLVKIPGPYPFPPPSLPEISSVRDGICVYWVCGLWESMAGIQLTGITDNSSH
jgi:hypothetical protein